MEKAYCINAMFENIKTEQDKSRIRRHKTKNYKTYWEDLVQEWAMKSW